VLILKGLGWLLMAVLPLIPAQMWPSCGPEIVSLIPLLDYPLDQAPGDPLRRSRLT
jgi:hypothetical protein